MLGTRLNTGLPTRSSKGLVPTPAGRSFAAAEAILERVNEAERAATSEYTAPKGDLVVMAPAMFGRLQILLVVTGFPRTPPPSVPDPASDAPTAKQARWHDPKQNLRFTWCEAGGGTANRLRGGVMRPSAP